VNLARRANRHEAIAALGRSGVEFHVQSGLSERDQVVVGFEEAENMALVKPVEPLFGADDKCQVRIEHPSSSPL
jgi:hypothetical protein